MGIKKISIILVTLIMIFSLTNISYAYSFSATLTPSSTTVAAGSECTATVKVTNLDVGDNGISAFSCVVSYDTNVFEPLSASSFTALNGWSIQDFNQENSKILLVKSSFTKTSEDIFQITLKVKSGVTTGTVGKISCGTVKSSNGETDISALDISTSITVGTASIITPTNPITNTNTNTNTNSNSNTVVNKNKNTNTNTAIPKAGENDSILCILLVIATLSAIFYVKYKNM